ncbi:MAG: cell division protein ZapE [Gammaproteobacteria bacterium]|nr:cell division protein ZapE [Gammaproteobacteria bacterium]
MPAPGLLDPNVQSQERDERIDAAELAAPGAHLAQCRIVLPVLDEARENAARRFIALVDELYDRGVGLVVSAAAPIDRLYRGTRLQFEFKRTASRLVEMRSSEHLAREHLA